MELRYTKHARERMIEEQITHADIESVLSGQHEVYEQQDTIRYHALVEGRALGVVVKRRTFPPLIITAFNLWASTGE